MGGGVLPIFYTTYKSRDFQIQIDLFDPKAGPTRGKIIELRTLEDLSYGQFKGIPKDIFERLKSHTRDITEIIRDLQQIKQEYKKLKDSYKLLSKQHNREGKMMQKVLRNYIDERRKLKKIIKMLKQNR